MTRVGIIDLGSNSSRLIIYEYHSEEHYRPVFEMKQNIRLAHRMDKSGRLDADGIARAVACTSLFQTAGRLYNVDVWTAVATAAVRQARNQEEILEALYANTGLRFRVINGYEEGRYGYLGVINTLDVKNCVLFDVGGASSEVMLVENRKLVDVTSLPFGALTMTERFPNLSERERGQAVYDWMTEEFEKIPWFTKAKQKSVVGLGGTARALAKLAAWKHGHVIENIHGYPVHPGDVSVLFDELRNMTPPRRKKIKGLSKHRAEIVTAGLGIVSSLLDTLQAQSVLVSRSGLRQGIFYEHLLRAREDSMVPDVLVHSVGNFQANFGVAKPVAEIVTNVSLKVLTGIRQMRSLPMNADRLLWVMAQIESCGCFINTEKWNTHSAYLTVSSHLYGLSYEERQELARMLNGNASPAYKGLLLILRLAKLLTLQLGITQEEVVVEAHRQQLCVGRAENIEETIQVSGESELAVEIARFYDIELQYLSK